MTVDISKCVFAFSPESLSNLVNFVTKIVTKVKFTKSVNINLEICWIGLPFYDCRYNKVYVCIFS